MNIWIASALVSLVGHGAIAVWLGTHDAPPKPPKPPTVVRFQAWRPEPPKPPPPPPPKVEPPPPPKTPPPKVVKKPNPRPVAPEPPPPATQTHLEEPKNSSITPDQTAPGGDLTTTTGDGLAGPINASHGTAPPETPPAPPAPPPKPKTVYVPIPEVSKLPRAIDPVEPEVPEEWKTSGRDAVVVVEVAITAHGHVVDARVVKKAGHGLDEAAVAAARKTRFEPALVGTKPVAVRMQLPYRFKVRG
jgi:TonB family protein